MRLPGRAEPYVGKAGMENSFQDGVLGLSLHRPWDFLPYVSLPAHTIQNECAAVYFLFQYVMKQELEPSVDNYKRVCVCTTCGQSKHFGKILTN